MERTMPNMDISILIYELPEELVDSAVKYLEEFISIPLSSMKYMKMVPSGLEVYFDGATSFDKAILEGAIEIFGTVYHIYPLVTYLTVHGACQYVNEQSMKILMSTLGKVLLVWREKELNNNYRVVIHHPEIYEKIQSWPESSAKVFGNDVMFPITFFCRLCRRNGHTRHQCPKTRVHSTIKTEPDSTFGKDVSQRSFEFQSFPKRKHEESPTQREETVSDTPLDAALKTTKHSDTLCFKNTSAISQNKRKAEIKSNGRNRKSFSYKSLIPPSLRDTEESFTKFCLKLVRTPNSFEVAKQYPRGIEVLLEQLSSYVNFNINLMETRRNCEKQFIIAIDSLIPKLKFQLQLEKLVEIMSKQKNDTDGLDFNLSSNTNVVGSGKVTSNHQNHDSIVNLEIDKVSTCFEKPAEKDSMVVKKDEFQKPISVVVDSKNPKVLNDLRRDKIPKQALDKFVGKVTERNKLYKNQATKVNSSAKILKGTQGEFKGVSFAESALKKYNQTSFSTSTEKQVKKPKKKLKISKQDFRSKSSCNVRINKIVTGKCQSVENFNHDISNFACSTSNCCVGRDSARGENTISIKRSHNTKIIDKASKYSRNVLSYQDIPLKGKMQDKVVSAGYQIKKKGKEQDHRGVKSLDMPAESTTVSEVAHKNEFQIEENKKKIVYNVRQGLVEIPFSKGVLTQRELNAFLIHVRNKRNPYKIAVRYSTDVGKIIQQLEQIVKKYFLELNPRNREEKEIDWLENLSKRLRSQETRMKNFDSRRNEAQDQIPSKMTEKSSSLSNSQFHESSEVIRPCYQNEKKNKLPFTIANFLSRLERHEMHA